MLDSGAAHHKISLTPDEETFLSQVQFDVSIASNGARERSLQAACSLARSLVARNGMPRIRWLYFIDPALNIGETRSRKQVFEDSLTDGQDILLDPRFLPILHYWIFGPQLPPEVVNWFLVAVAHHTELRVLRRSLRQMVRDQDLEPAESCEEFFKLGLEAGLHAETAWSLRTTVRAMRTYTRSHAH